MRGAGRARVGLRAAPALAPALAALGVVVLGLAVVLAACSASAETPTAVPTFPTAERGGAAASDPADDGRVVPADCGRILAAPDLEAVLGLPLGTVHLRTTIGVAESSVGRTERVACDYSRTGERRGSARPLLDVNASAYRDPGAAAAQWRVNVEAESGDRRDVPLGSAQAVLFERRGQAVLMVAHATSNVTLVLPDQPLPGGRSRADVLVDLALRVLPAVSDGPTAAPPPSAPAQVSQAGAAR